MLTAVTDRVDQAGLPRARGPLSDRLTGLLRDQPGTLSAAAESAVMDLAADELAHIGDAEAMAHDDDLQLSWWMLNELSYHGLRGVADGWEWDTTPLLLRRLLSGAFEDLLRDHLGERIDDVAADPDGVGTGIGRLVDTPDRGPSLSRYVERSITAEQWLEFLRIRSLYQLKEADPHSLAIPRLHGPAKVALVEIQYDEYGSGHPEREHAQLFRQTLTACGLDDGYAAFLDLAPAVTLANSNLMTMLGLQRRLRGAAIGHLAMYELSSPQANRKYARGAQRLGYDERARAYFDEHVVADAIHGEIAIANMVGSFLAAEPEQAGNVAFGAVAGMYLDSLTGRHQVERWQAGESAQYAGGTARYAGGTTQGGTR